MSFALAQTAFTEAAAAVRSQDYSTALDRLLEAQLYMQAVPDSQKDGAMMTFCRNIDAQIKAIERRESRAIQSTAGGVQKTLVEYERADSECN